MIKLPDISSVTPEILSHPKEGIKSAINTMRQTIIGSGSFGQEIKGVGSAYAEGFTNTLLTPPKALYDLVTLHPIKAVHEATDGIGSVIRNSLKIVTSPSRLAIGATVSAAKLPAKALAGVAKSPLLVWGALAAGTNRIAGLMDRFSQWNNAGVPPPTVSKEGGGKGADVIPISPTLGKKLAGKEEAPKATVTEEPATAIAKEPVVEEPAQSDTGGQMKAA